jgi:hypothetical protein
MWAYQGFGSLTVVDTLPPASVLAFFAARFTQDSTLCGAIPTVVLNGVYAMANPDGAAECYCNV